MRTAMLLATLLGLTGCDASFGTRPPLDPVAYNLSLDAANPLLDVQRYAMAMPRRSIQTTETTRTVYLRRQ